MEIPVKLNNKLARRGQGFVDPSNGVAIAVGRQKKHGFQLVPETSFIRARLHEGSLIRVEMPDSMASENSSSSGSDNDAGGDDPGSTPATVEIVFSKKYSFGGDNFKKGDRVKLGAEEAELLVQEGVATRVESSDAP